MNRLFSQKKGNKVGVSKQIDGNTIGGVKYRHSNLYYDDLDVKEMIAGEFKWLKTEGGKVLSQDTSKKSQSTDGDASETTGQKMKKLVQKWKDAYRTFDSKEGSMEKVLSMLNGMFHLKISSCQKTSTDL